MIKQLNTKEIGIPNMIRNTFCYIMSSFKNCTKCIEISKFLKEKKSEFSQIFYFKVNSGYLNFAILYIHQKTL